MMGNEIRTEIMNLEDLSQMTKKELWQLFPIVLTEHKDFWKDWYQEEAERLMAILQNEKVRLNHIGSTAIEGIWAKPIIDILLEIPKEISMEHIKKLLVQSGYICMSEEKNRKSFNRGYTPKGYAQKVFHLHLRYFGDHDEIYFRDFLNQNPTTAREYEKLKLSLWKRYEHDRDGYTEAKTDFVSKVMNSKKTEAS